MTLWNDNDRFASRAVLPRLATEDVHRSTARHHRSAATRYGALLTPQQLRQITKDTASAERQEVEAVAKKAEATREGAFMAREIRPDVMEYLMTAARHHAEHEEHEPNG